MEVGSQVKKADTTQIGYVTARREIFGQGINVVQFRSPIRYDNTITTELLLDVEIVEHISNAYTASEAFDEMVDAIVDNSAFFSCNCDADSCWGEEPTSDNYNPVYHTEDCDTHKLLQMRKAFGL